MLNVTQFSMLLARPVCCPTSTHLYGFDYSMWLFIPQVYVACACSPQKTDHRDITSIIKKPVTVTVPRKDDPNMLKLLDGNGKQQSVM
eukprot:2262735-Amphidinium_carterae.1